ncbi:glycosyltransferase family 4 protein [Candidatus Stoquefichus sp. SB1]|uniref:glycosyltransferase family 4 protein n=1 Tax=Candidatus Stoquefichus sp. SB1 TaxID=1658109 RepID=UPI00067EB8F9|nr:glycosyltransferase family 4 protein [Candidatus Stoquefichus sp. SB1]
MKDKVLILASVASMIDQFNMSNIDILISLGYEVHVACNFEKGSTCSQEKIVQLKKKLGEIEVKYYQIDFTRSVFNILQDVKAYRQVKRIMVENSYKFIHCHSPIGGVIGRLACKSTHTRCIYTAHGFHFYKGAPIKNWIVFYPIEKWLSKYTDVLITISKEDYNRAKNKFKMKQLEYIPGVGVDIEKFRLTDIDREKYRKQLGFTEKDFLILSVGELNKNKNHQVIIKAIKSLKNSNIKYIIAGQGNLKSDLMHYIEVHNLSNQVKLLGFREDIPELCKISDVFAFPSLREGLGLAAIEAMAAGLPLITSNINGINDYSKFGKTGYSYNATDVEGFSDGIKLLFLDVKKRIIMSEYCKQVAKKYDIKLVNIIMEKIYLGLKYE